jgi:hypothetical protein
MPEDDVLETLDAQVPESDKGKHARIAEPFVGKRYYIH